MRIISETSFVNRSFSETHPPSFPFSRSRFLRQQGRRWKPNFPEDWGTSRSWREISPATQKSRGLEEDVRAMVTKIVDYVVFLIKFWTNHFSKQRVIVIFQWLSFYVSDSGVGMYIPLTCWSSSWWHLNLANIGSAKYWLISLMITAPLVGQRSNKLHGW